MKFVFERQIVEMYEVEAIDASHAQELMDGCEDLAEYLLYSHTSEEFKLVGTKISQGNILPTKKERKKKE